MQPFSSLATSLNAEPKVELLRRLGGSGGTSTGDYCLAWRGRDEVVFEWARRGLASGRRSRGS